jgi:hypothetical protein
MGTYYFGLVATGARIFSLRDKSQGSVYAGVL